VDKNKGITNNLANRKFMAFLVKTLKNSE